MTYSEFELRNAYRPFYSLSDEAFVNLKKWAESSPHSYAAHLALGIYYKRKGSDARGSEYMSKTPSDRIEHMRYYYRKASIELVTSLTLTEKPYLSLFHLQTIEQQNGNREALLILLRKANEYYPDNFLVRSRHALSLTPRWGGSYKELDAFIASSISEGAPTDVIKRLVAIEYNDKGHTLEEINLHDQAMQHFTKALELGAEVGGTFAEEFLGTSRYYACRGKKDYPGC